MISVRITLIVVLGFATVSCRHLPIQAGCDPDPIFEKLAPITMAELKKMQIRGVQAVEVNDYAPGLFRGEIKSGSPHADHNPKKAVIIAWEKGCQRLVFSHEGSYCPWLELTNGVGLCNQFFEGNSGTYELFNKNGRKERNSFVDILQSGPDRAWVRWNYFCVSKKDDSDPALRGTEDYITYPNGLIWRRLTYQTLIPESSDGYSWQPVDFFAIAPQGSDWGDLFGKTPQGDYCVGIIADLYSHREYRKFWSDEGKPRREGDDDLLWQIAKSKGFVMIMPFKNGFEFVVLGESGGWPASKNQVVDHSYTKTGGWGWNAARWNHWPIGWINDQGNVYSSDQPYPYHFGPFSHYLVPFRFTDAGQDYPAACADMALNRWTERRVFYTLSGVAKDVPAIRKLARQWLDKGTRCADPDSVGDLKIDP